MNEIELFDPYQTSRFIETDFLLHGLIAQDFIDPSHISGNVLNWGCGTGGECYAFRINDAVVTGVDRCKDNIKKVIETNILDSKNAIVSCGNEYLKTVPDNAYDMVTGIMFTPSYGPPWESLFIKFYNQANRTIKNSGRIMITSDWGTMLDVGKILKSKSEGYYDYFKDVYHTRSDCEDVYVCRKNLNLLQTQI